MAALVISMGVLAYGYGKYPNSTTPRERHVANAPSDSAFIGTTITHESFKRDFGLLPSQKTKAEINEVTGNITSICTCAIPTRHALCLPKLNALERDTAYLQDNL
jgi:hypothetical protein